MMDATVQISIAGTADAELIADLSRRTFYDAFAPHNTPENMEQFLQTQFAREILMQEVGAPRNTFLLARLNDQPAGYARLYEGTELPPGIAGTNSIEIARLYAEQQVIGKGIGKALMMTCLDIAGEKEKEWIWLGVWIVLVGTGLALVPNAPAPIRAHVERERLIEHTPVPVTGD